MNIRMNYTMRQEESKNANMPMVPLPNEGEGGALPVLPTVPTNPSTDGFPVIPLPNVGEGGAVAPIIPNPIPPRPTPVPPTPGNLGGIIATIITTYPRPNIPCDFCNNQKEDTGMVRFLNGANDYNAFCISVNDQVFVQPFYYAEVTEFEKVPSGSQMITVAGEDGYVFIQQSVAIPKDENLTVAIMATASGLELVLVSDGTCDTPSYVSCVRTSNLCHDTGALDLVVGKDYLTFLGVEPKETTNFKVIWPDNYYFYVKKSKEDGILLSAQLQVKANKKYTIYLLKWNNTSSEAVRALIVEE